MHSSKKYKKQSINEDREKLTNKIKVGLLPLVMSS